MTTVLNVPLNDLEIENSDLSDIDVLVSLKEIHYSNENYLNEFRLNQQRNDFSIELLSCIKEQYFEYGVTSKADALVANQLQIDKFFTMNTLTELFVNNFDNPPILVGILQIVSRISDDIINPQGQSMAKAALNHKNLEVRECGIRCFENWVTLNSLNILENISVEPKWLQDYLIEVMNNIKEDLCPTL